MKIYSVKNSTSEYPKKRKWKFNWKKIDKKKALIWGFRFVAIGVLLSALFFAYLWLTLPTPGELIDRAVAESTKIYDREGNVLYEVHGEFKRTIVDLDAIPKNLQNATISIEDKDFYKHKGFSLWAIFRTAVTDVIYRRSAGGSTITQQFVKNAVLTSDKTPIRKLKELFLAVQLETRYTKDEILKFYLNEIPYGRNAYGAEAAAQAYFGKPAKDVTLAESAYLAALPQAPSFYNPLGANRKSLDARQKKVLASMKEEGYISEAEEQKALAEVVNFKQAKTSLLAPHFVLYIQDYLSTKFGEKTLQEGGMKVYTTIDPKLQEAAEKIIKENAESNTTKYDAANAGLVAIDPKTGQILAMVGSKDYFGTRYPQGCENSDKKCQFDPNVNVTTSDRQPGSSFKPFVYLTAFTRQFKYSPSTPLFDVSTNFGTFNGQAYQPSNYNGQENGLVTMRKGLAGSLNIPAVKTLSLVGVDNAIETARKLGITSPMKDCGLSLVLGGCEVKLLDHTAAFSVIANMGKRNDKTGILKIEDKDGKILEEYKQNEREVIDPQAAYQLISVMTDNAARSFVFGGNSPLNFGDRQVGCKTGTTNSWHDGWTMCFTPSVAVGVWAGNSNGKLMKKGADGVLVAAPSARAFILEALKGKTSENFERPAGIHDVVIDEASGKLPTAFSGTTRSEVFADYNSPGEYDDVHVGVKFDTTTGQPANELTPSQNIETRLYTVYHSERPSNPSWEDPVVTWAINHGFLYPPQGSIIVNPEGATNVKQGNFSVDVVTPSEGSPILALPFGIKVNISNGTQISRIDLSVDGTQIGTINSAPYEFSVSKSLSDGEHTFVIKAVDNQGEVAQTSVRVVYSLNQQLYLNDPKNNESISLPSIFTALSLQDLGNVSFYYINKSNVNKLLGAASKGDQNGSYIYELPINSMPINGNVKIFAKSDTGITSNKITISVP